MLKIALCFVFAACNISCNDQAPDNGEQDTEITTPVTVTSITTAPMAEYIELNATSSFLQKSIVKANSNGYLKAVNAKVGKMVQVGQVLFELKTKEAQSIGNTINALDSTFKFSGLISIRAALTGHVSEVDHQTGDYVQEGEQLAIINDVNSFVFVLNLPYELRPYISANKKVLLEFPDGEAINGIISEITAMVDSSSQTQNVFIKVKEHHLPVNLVAKVTIQKIAKTNVTSLPKSSVLSDETQTNFWVMKVIDDSTAGKRSA